MNMGERFALTVSLLQQNIRIESGMNADLSDKTDQTATIATIAEHNQEAVHNNHKARTS